RQTGPLSSLAWQHGRAHREADEPGRRLSLDPPGGGCADLKQPSSSGEGIEKTEVCRVGSHGGYGGRQRIATFWAEDAPGIITKVGWKGARWCSRNMLGRWFTPRSCTRARSTRCSAPLERWLPSDPIAHPPQLTLS